MQLKHDCKRKKKRKNVKSFSLSRAYMDVREALFHDLGDGFRHPTMSHGKLEKGSPCDGMPPNMFKRAFQLESFDKRIIWKTDKRVSDIEMESIQDFISSQTTFGFNDIGKDSVLNALVDITREIICNILGDFDFDTFAQDCAFGRRSARGLPRSKSYLAMRSKKLCGTNEQREWFKAVASMDPHLLRASRQSNRKTRCRRYGTITSSGKDELTRVTTVPKNSSTARVISLPSVLGGFLSRGLGNYIRSQLEKHTHIDLSLQQQRHKNWVIQASIDGLSATLDMRKASDSFVWNHILLLLPKSWHSVIKVCRGTKVADWKSGNKEGKIVLKSIMLMGSGHTFPLQTLLFYAMCEAVRVYTSTRGRVSAYGDDLIIPTSTARQCIVFLNRLGFTVNSEKSFFDVPDVNTPSRTHIRESCGEDRKGGIAVRPYRPEINLQEKDLVCRNIFISEMHKLINGLLDRWSQEEIPVTISCILSYLQLTGYDIHFVPTWETDTAGIRHEISEEFLLGRNVSRPFANASTHWLTSYRRLGTKIRMRSHLTQRMYYWYSLYCQRTKYHVDQYQNVKDHLVEGIQLLPETRRDIDPEYAFAQNIRHERPA